MKLVIKGSDLIATEALSAKMLIDLIPLAARRPLSINGVRLRADDLRKLAEKANQTGQAIELGDIKQSTQGQTKTHVTRKPICPVKSEGA